MQTWADANLGRCKLGPMQTWTDFEQMLGPACLLQTPRPISYSNRNASMG